MDVRIAIELSGIRPVELAARITSAVQRAVEVAQRMPPPGAQAAYSAHDSVGRHIGTVTVATSHPAPTTHARSYPL